MNNKKAKLLRRQAVGDPDYTGRIFAREDNKTTWLLHPHDKRAQYKEAKRRAKRGEHV